jgi:hypothetical protein
VARGPGLPRLGETPHGHQAYLTRNDCSTWGAGSQFALPG